jgi:hypothetical protein
MTLRRTAKAAGRRAEARSAARQATAPIEERSCHSEAGTATAPLADWSREVDRPAPSRWQRNLLIFLAGAAASLGGDPVHGTLVAILVAVWWK